MYKIPKDACNTMDLLQYNGEWIQCLEEVSTICIGASLYNLFVLTLSKYYPTSVFSTGDQATFVASGGWPRWCIFGGNSPHLLQKYLDRQQKKPCTPLILSYCSNNFIHICVMTCSFVFVKTVVYSNQ
jgi:hypothetical protein